MWEIICSRYVQLTNGYATDTNATQRICRWYRIRKNIKIPESIIPCNAGYYKGIVLHFLEKGLVKWFDEQPYNAKFGQRLSYSTLLIFSVIFAQISQGFTGKNSNLREGYFLMMLQSLRQLTKRKDFPLYGGIFASFSGENLRETLTYFDDPLKEVESTQEKARILTLLAYSQLTIGN